MANILRRYLKFVIRHAGVVTIAVILLATGTAAWLVLASPIKLDTNFTTLLPQELPCVIESKRISELIGSTDYLMVTVQSPVVEDNIAIIEEIAKKLKSFPEIEWISTVQDRSYFRNRRLLYLDTPDLETVLQRAKARLDYEKKIANPFYVSLDDEQPPDISLDDIMERYRLRLEKRGATGLIKEKKTDEESTKKLPGIDVGDRYAADGGTLMSLLARPNKPALDMDFGRSLVEKTQQLIDSSNPKRNPTMRIEVVGSYRNRYQEYQAVVGDIFSSIGVAIGLILLLIIGYFRRVRAVALVFIPLIVGILLTVGLTALTLGRLSMTTALIFAVLLGLGIDFGVHMSVRYLDERARGKTLEESLALAVINTGKAILIAGLTTAGGLGVLMLARFKGFSEFGIIAMLGIASCLAVYIILLPAMAVLMERVSVPRPWRKRDSNEQVNRRPGSISRRPLFLGLAAILVASIAGLSMIPSIQFEYDFSKLRGHSTGTGLKYGKTLGQGSSPVVAVLPTQEDSHKLTRHLEKIVDTYTGNNKLVRRAFSIFSFVPDNQPAKLELLKQLRGYVHQALSLKKLKKDTRDQLEEIESWTNATTITIDELPEWVKGKFQEKDGTIGRMVYIFPAVYEWDIKDMERFYKVYGTIDVPGKGQIRPSASGFIMVEVVRAVQRDGWLMTVVAIGVVFILLLVNLRSLKKTIIVFLPLLVGVAWTLGIMGIFDIRIGLYNMLVLPTMLGIGVDASVHFYHSYREHGPGSIRYVFKTTGAAITIAAATTGVGFTGMLIVNHDGLRTIGVLALVGIGATLAAALTTMPLILALAETFNSNSKSE
jgi:uncharacterized protein